MNQKAKALRKELKEKFNFSNRQVSITSDYSSINVHIKHLDAAKKYDEIKTIAETYEKIYRDEASGEILSGGNDFVFVNIDESAYEFYYELAESLVKILDEFNFVEYKNLQIWKLDKFTLKINEIYYNRNEESYKSIAKHIAMLGEK